MVPVDVTISIEIVDEVKSYLFGCDLRFRNRLCIRCKETLVFEIR